MDVIRSLVSEGKTFQAFRIAEEFYPWIQMEELWKEKYSKKYKFVLILVGYTKESLIGPWDDSTKGLKGSEESVVYFSQELARRRIQVAIACSPTRNQPMLKNPYYFDTLRPPKFPREPDAVIFWRRNSLSYYNQFANKKHCKKFYWTHDLYIPKEPFFQFHYFLLLSQFEKQFYQLSSSQNAIVIGNGIPDNATSYGIMEKREPQSICYLSNYSRGLETIIDHWKDIKLEFPKAKLYIYYGRETWNTMSRDHLDSLIRKIENCPDVIEKGSVDHETLMKDLQKISIWAYPVNMFETFCISAIRAQACGLVPVYIERGALQETVMNKRFSSKNEEEFFVHLKEALQGYPEMEEERLQYSKIVKSIYSWKTSVDLFTQLL